MAAFIRRSALPLVFAILAAAAGADAADQAKPPVFGSDVSLVQIPVFVAGRDHGAATGLKASDFSVKQDGREVEIVSFQYVDTTAFEGQDDIRRSSAARRRFLLLFDKSFTDPAGLARARDAARQFVRTGLAPSDLAGVATFDYLRGIRLVANFTEDRRVVEHAIYTLGTQSLTRITDPLALAADLQVTDLQREKESDTQDTPADLLNEVMAAMAARVRSADDQAYKVRVGMLLESFRTLGESLRHVPGRKQVVYFSTGFSNTLLAGQNKTDQARTSEAIAEGRIWEVDSDQRYGDTVTRGMMDEALRSLARADAVVHTVDLSGLGEREKYNQAPDSTVAARDASGRESLNYIAAETGGRFFKDANDYAPVLREMADMTSRYYVLGVQPDATRPDGGFRRLQVKVKARGLRVSHRPGFFERPLATAAAAPAPILERQFEAAELLVSGNSNGARGAGSAAAVPFDVLLLPIPANDVKQPLGVVVQVPRSSLDRGDGPLELFGYAIARSGAVADHFAHFVKVEASEPSKEGTLSRGLSFAGRLDLPPGDYTLRLLAQRGSESSMRLFDVTIPRREISRGFLLPPLFLDAAGTWAEVALRNGANTGLPLRLEIGGSPIVPRSRVEVRPGRRERLVLVAFEPEAVRDPAIDIDIRSALTDETGRTFAPGVISVESVARGEGGRRSYLLGFTPGDVPPGEYTLRVHIGEADSVLRSYARIKVLPRETASREP